MGTSETDNMKKMGQSDPKSTFRIQIQEQPEGVWLATSEQIPGLFVEGASEKEAREEAARWAKELLVDNAGLAPDAEVTLIFDRENLTSAHR